MLSANDMTRAIALTREQAEGYTTACRYYHVAGRLVESENRRKLAFQADALASSLRRALVHHKAMLQLLKERN